MYYQRNIEARSSNYFRCGKGMSNTVRILSVCL
jgi:hypothetical protein